MSITFNEQCNYVKEVTLFLYRYFNHETFQDLDESLKKKSGYTKEVKSILTHVGKIYDEISSQIEVPNSLSMYFEDYKEEEILVSGLADCILFACFFTQNQNINELKTLVKEKFHQDDGRFLLHCLEGNAFEITEDNKEPLTREEFVTFLNKNIIKESMKWKVFNVYEQFDEHVDNLLDFIGEILPVFEKVYDKNENVFSDFNAFWKRAEETGSMEEKLKKVTFLEFDIKDTDVLIRPTWMGCNGAYMYGEKTWDNLLVFMGLFFTDYNFFHQERVSDEEMCARLKLISDPSKYEILKLVKEEGKYGAQLAQHLNLTTATISHHVNALMSAGLITIEKDVNRIYYHTNKEILTLCVHQLQQDLCEE